MPKFDYQVGQTYRQRDGKTTDIVELRANGAVLASNGFYYNLYMREDINSHVLSDTEEDEDLMEQLS
jgi:hypothetical protein